MISTSYKCCSFQTSFKVLLHFCSRNPPFCWDQNNPVFCGSTSWTAQTEDSIQIKTNCILWSNPNSESNYSDLIQSDRITFEELAPEAVSKLTRSERSSRDTHLKDRTGIKEAVCPHEANSWNKHLTSHSQNTGVIMNIITHHEGLPGYKGLLHAHSLVALSEEALSCLQASKSTERQGLQC